MEAKTVIFQFFEINVKNLIFHNKVVSYFQICENLKKKFLISLERRRHKIKMLSEYWAYVAETCLYNNQAKNLKIAKKFNGHKFFLIPE